MRLAGGRCVHIPLQPADFRYDWERVAASITPRTRLIIINSPHNPSCTVATAADLDALAALVRDRDILVLSTDGLHDEMKEPMIAEIVSQKKNMDKKKIEILNLKRMKNSQPFHHQIEIMKEVEAPEIIIHTLLLSNRMLVNPLEKQEDFSILI